MQSPVPNRTHHAISGTELYPLRNLRYRIVPTMQSPVPNCIHHAISGTELYPPCTELYSLRNLRYRIVCTMQSPVPNRIRHAIIGTDTACAPPELELETVAASLPPTSARPLCVFADFQVGPTRRDGSGCVGHTRRGEPCAQLQFAATQSFGTDVRYAATPSSGTELRYAATSTTPKSGAALETLPLGSAL
eukprot:403203-Rhodomonas_salina.1